MGALLATNEKPSSPITLYKRRSVSAQNSQCSNATITKKVDDSDSDDEHPSTSQDNRSRALILTRNKFVLLTRIFMSRTQTYKRAIHC
jgi:hypothetical protein